MSYLPMSVLCNGKVTVDFVSTNVFEEGIETEE